jgi:hypothetical protein
VGCRAGSKDILLGAGWLWRLRTWRLPSVVVGLRHGMLPGRKTTKAKRIHQHHQHVLSIHPQHPTYIQSSAAAPQSGTECRASQSECAIADTLWLQSPTPASRYCLKARPEQGDLCRGRNFGWRCRRIAPGRSRAGWRMCACAAVSGGGVNSGCESVDMVRLPRPATSTPQAHAKCSMSAVLPRAMIDACAALTCIQGYLAWRWW